MRASTIRPLIELLTYYPEGLTRREMIGKIRIPNAIKKTLEDYTFSRITIERHIKTLTNLGIIERIVEPKGVRKRGRPNGRYRIRNVARQNLELTVFIVPNLWKIDEKWYTGVEVRNSKRKAYKHLRKNGLKFQSNELSIYTHLSKME